MSELIIRIQKYFLTESTGRSAPDIRKGLEPGKGKL